MSNPNICVSCAGPLPSSMEKIHSVCRHCTAKGLDVAGPKPFEGATGAREFWNTLPHCAGYGGNCDGDLVGIEHEKDCPLFGKKELNYFEFAEAYASSQLKKLDGVAQQAAEKIASEMRGEPSPDGIWWAEINAAKKIAAIIAERLSK